MRERSRQHDPQFEQHANRAQGQPIVSAGQSRTEEDLFQLLEMTGFRLKRQLSHHANRPSWDEPFTVAAHHSTLPLAGPQDDG